MTSFLEGFRLCNERVGGGAALPVEVERWPLSPWHRPGSRNSRPEPGAVKATPSDLLLLAKPTP